MATTETQQVTQSNTTASGQPAKSTQPCLHVTDSRTGESHNLPITRNAIAAVDFQKFRAPEDPEHPEDQNNHGLRVLDPGYQNTAVKESKITYVDGQRAIIQYRGIPIDDLVGKASFEDVAHLLIWGKLPSEVETAKLHQGLAQASCSVGGSVFDVIRAFPKSAPTLPMIVSGISAFQASQPELIPAFAGKNLYLKNMGLVDQEIIKAMGAMSAIFTFAYCHRNGREWRKPDPGLSYTENIFHMIGFVDETTGKPDPHKISCMERLGTTVADHEMTCSTAAYLQTASALPDPFSCLISAYSAGYGILHGGAIEVAFKNIRSVGSVENVPKKIEDVKSGKERLYGYGHRLYKVTDPRSIHIRKVLDDLGNEVQQDPLLKIAFEIDRVASTDEYFVQRRLNPNADLFASFAYKALGFDEDFILPLSILSRARGFMAQWREAMAGTARIWRPQQLYTGDLNL